MGSTGAMAERLPMVSTVLGFMLLTAGYHTMIACWRQVLLLACWSYMPAGQLGWWGCGAHFASTVGPSVL
jgi:hypothetical protein